jgi:hypothetical protein
MSSLEQPYDVGTTPLWQPSYPTFRVKPGIKDYYCRLEEIFRVGHGHRSCVLQMALWYFQASF